ncbi:MAG: ferrous iron transport protein A [Spirochaetes bacterium]|nr:ferrous iron transport protein A [Spirochaetota bacterium]
MVQEKKYMECSLIDIQQGETVMISRINGSHKLTVSLINIGIAPGNIITVISGSKNYPYIVDFAGSKIALTWAVSKNIIVKKLYQS